MADYSNDIIDVSSAEEMEGERLMVVDSKDGIIAACVGECQRLDGLIETCEQRLTDLSDQLKAIEDKLAFFRSQHALHAAEQAAVLQFLELYRARYLVTRDQAIFMTNGR